MQAHPDHNSATAGRRTGRKIGLIAGNGQFPLIFARAARQKGLSVCAVAHIGETVPELEAHVDAVRWLHVGQIKKLIKFFKRSGVDVAAMIGGIRKTRMFADVRPDTKAIALFAAMKHTHDDGILRAFADVLEKAGIRVLPSTDLVPELLAAPGCWTRRTPSRAEKADIELGWKLAKEIGRLGIGQCVVMGAGSVLAVEAIDGTDATIARGAGLGRGNAVVVKICKPNQDLRFDIPAVGVETIETMAANGATALAVEAGRTVVFDRDRMIATADGAGIAIVALEGVDD